MFIRNSHIKSENPTSPTGGSFIYANNTLENRHLSDKPSAPFSYPHIQLADTNSLTSQPLAAPPSNTLTDMGMSSFPLPVPTSNIIAGMSLYNMPSSLSLLQATQIYQRLNPQLPYLNIQSILSLLPQNNESCLSQKPSQSEACPSSNRSSPASSLPPPASKREVLSSPVSPQSLPAQSSLYPSSPSPSPPLASRKRAADSPPEQDAPIDLSVKRPKYSPPVSLPDLTPINLPFSFLQLPSVVPSAAPAVPVDLTSTA